MSKYKYTIINGLDIIATGQVHQLIANMIKTNTQMGASLSHFKGKEAGFTSDIKIMLFRGWRGKGL